MDINTQSRTLNYLYNLEEFMVMRKLKRNSRTENRKNETLKFGETRKALEWLELMYYAVQVDSESEALDFFQEVENLANKFGFILENGRKFSSANAIHDWKIVEKKVEEWIDELEREYGDDVEDLPCVGLQYRNHGDILVLGIHDGVGGFDEMSAWGFVNKED